MCRLSRLRRSLRRSRRLIGRDDKGAAAVEFGLLVPFLGLSLLATTDLGLALYRKMQVEDAAQAGAQYAIAHGFDAAAITNAVASATNSSAVSATPAPTQFCGCPTGSGIGTVTCGSVCTGGATAGTYTTVYAQGNFPTFLDYQIVSSYTMNSQATVRLQ